MGGEGADEGEGGAEAGGVVEGADDDEAGAGGDGRGEGREGDFAEDDAAAGELGGGVGVVGELGVEGEDFVAGLPVEAVEGDGEAVGSARDEGDVGGGGVDKGGEFGAEAVEGVKPEGGVGGGGLLAVLEVADEGLIGGSGKLAHGGRIEKGTATEPGEEGGEI